MDELAKEMFDDTGGRQLNRPQVSGLIDELLERGSAATEVAMETATAIGGGSGVNREGYDDRLCRWYPSPAGAPQGGIISPRLSNLTSAKGDALAVIQTYLRDTPIPWTKSLRA